MGFAVPPALVVANPTVEEFDALVSAHEVVVVDFAATWCAPCRAYSPKFSRAAREMRRRDPEGSFVFAMIDVDARPELARKFSVRSVPTTVVVAEKPGLFGRRRKVLRRWSGDVQYNELLRDMASAVGVDL